MAKIRNTISKLEKLLNPVDAEYCYAVPGASSMIDVINPETGLTWIFGESLDSVRERHPGADRMKISDFLNGQAARQNAAIIWTTCTEETFYEMMEILPPAYMGNHGFLVGEPWDHHTITGEPRYSAYRYIGGKYITANRSLTVPEFKSL